MEEIISAVDITEADFKIIQRLLASYIPDTTVWIYGSRVKGTSTPKSDLDLVVFSTPEEEQQIGDLREEFEESDLPFRVDLFVWDDLPERFKEQIASEAFPLVNRVP